MPRPDHTAILCILDRSGSMESIHDDVVGGFTAFVTAQRADAGTATLTLVQFDDVYEVVYVDRALAEVPLPLVHLPRGSTALLDAVHRGVVELGAVLDAKPEADRPEKVLVAIITDGQENASTEVTRKAVRKLLDGKRAAGWEFVFLGAGLEDFADAKALGISDVVSFDRTSASTARAFMELDSRARSIRTVLRTPFDDDPQN